MRILFIAPRVHPNQVPIIEGFIENGDEIFYCVSHKNKYEEYAGATVKVISPSLIYKCYNNYLIKKHGENYAEKSSLYSFIPNIKELRKIIKKIKPAVVVVRNRSLFSLVTFWICKYLNIKKVLLYNQTPIYQKKQSTSIKKSFKIFYFSLFPKNRITVSRYNDYFLSKSGHKIIKDENAYFVPFVARIVQSDMNKEYFDNNKVRILDSGKFRDYKNHYLLVSLAKSLRSQGFSNFRITIQGQVTNDEEMKYYDDLQNLVINDKLSEFISLEKGLNYGKMQELFLNHDLFILASRKEVANISILDAMAYGLPAISTSANGTSDYITDGYNGAIYKTNDVDSLSEVIIKYLKNPESIVIQGNNAKITAKENFNFGTYYSAFMNVFNNL